jgi:biotin synthase
MAGVNSIFTGDTSLTTGNAGALMAKHGFRAITVEEPTRVAAE